MKARIRWLVLNLARYRPYHPRRRAGVASRRRRGGGKNQRHIVTGDVFEPVVPGNSSLMVTRDCLSLDRSLNRFLNSRQSILSCCANRAWIAPSYPALAEALSCP